MLGAEKLTPKDELNELLDLYIRMIESYMKLSGKPQSEAQGKIGLQLLNEIKRYSNLSMAATVLYGGPIAFGFKIKPLFDQFIAHPIADMKGYKIAMQANSLLSIIASRDDLLSVVSTLPQVKGELENAAGKIQARIDKFDFSAIKSSSAVTTNTKDDASSTTASAKGDASSTTASALEQPSAPVSPDVSPESAIISENASIKPAAPVSIFEQFNDEQLDDLFSHFKLESILAKIGNIKDHQILLGGKVVNNMRLPTHLAEIYLILNSASPDSTKLSHIESILNAVGHNRMRSAKTQDLYNNLQELVAFESPGGSPKFEQYVLAKIDEAEAKIAGIYEVLKDPMQWVVSSEGVAFDMRPTENKTIQLNKSLAEIYLQMVGPPKDEGDRWNTQDPYSVIYNNIKAILARCSSAEKQTKWYQDLTKVVNAVVQDPTSPANVFNNASAFHAASAMPLVERSSTSQLRSDSSPRP